MSILTKGLGVAVATLVSTTLATAQSFNLDAGDPASPFGVPAMTYGAAAAQPGVWNSASSATGYAITVADLSGVGTSITTTVVGGGGDLSFDNLLTVDVDDAALLDDFQNGGGTATTWTFDGLSNGDYDVYTYAFAPDSTTFVSAVTPAGAGTQVVGGTFTGTNTPGTTYALHSVTVTSGTLDIEIAAAVSFASVNGFQFVQTAVGGPFSDSCNGDGGDQMGCTNCPCGNNTAPGIIGGCLNSNATSCRLLASGTESVGAADLRFEASGAPASVSAVLTSGGALAPANAANPCFGLNSGVQSVSLDGLRCAVQGVLRHGVRPSDANGDIGVTTNGWGTPNGFFNFAAFASGDTRHFQIIHRDDDLTICFTGQNTSQAVSVTFAP